MMICPDCMSRLAMVLNLAFRLALAAVRAWLSGNYPLFCQHCFNFAALWNPLSAFVPERG